MLDLKNKKVLITGASGGIGGALVKKFLSLNASVLGTGTNSEKLDSLKKKFQNIKVKKFIERNEVSIRDVLNFSRKVVSPEKFEPKPLYISPSQSLFAKYTGPKIHDKPLDVS